MIYFHFTSLHFIFMKTGITSLHFKSAKKWFWKGHFTSKWKWSDFELCSQPVTHVSTNPARRSLTSVIGRELVYSTRYDAKRRTAFLAELYIKFSFITRSFSNVLRKEFSKNAKVWNASRFCVSSLRRGHANLLCIVPILTDVQRVNDFVGFSAHKYLE